MATFFGSATPCLTSQFTPSIRSWCIFPAHSRLPAFRNSLPYPVEPRKFTWSTAYPRLASHCTIGLYPQVSRAHGPPWTKSTVGRFLGSAPTGLVRYPRTVSPSWALYSTGSICASFTFSSFGWVVNRNSPFLLLRSYV